MKGTCSPKMLGSDVDSLENLDFRRKKDSIYGDFARLFASCGVLALPLLLTLFVTKTRGFERATRRKPW